MPSPMDSQHHILLINRDRKLLATLGQSLLDAGFPVLTASTMIGALSLLSGSHVHLIICDSELEDFSGTEFLRYLKNSPLLRKIPFVFYVPVHDQGNAGRAFEMGAADFIVYTRGGENSKILKERLSKMLAFKAGGGRVQASPSEGRQAAASSGPGMRERRFAERVILKDVVNIEVSRDAILWLPCRIVNLSEQGLLIETSLLGRLGMLLYLRAPLPACGKGVVEGRIKHISMSKHCLSAEIGIRVEPSIAWIEIYDDLTRRNERGGKPAAASSPAPGKGRAPDSGGKIDAAMAAGRTDKAKPPVAFPLRRGSDSRGEKALEIKFYRSLVGKQLGNYKAVSFIGAGGMGGVFKGWDISLERNVALKVISYNLSSIPSYREMFIREARLVSRLTHPNIAQIYYIDQMDDVLYFAMELIGGGTLADVITDSNPLHAARGLEYFITVCRTLDFVSGKNIVHRDLKPANIMIDDQGALKVVDFGVAVVNSGADRGEKSEGLVGSPLYASPECIMGRPLDCRSDIYSLGATFYHVFAGVPPFEGEPVEAILYKHLNEDLVPLNRINPILSGDLSRIIGKMMAKNPGERYQDYQDLIVDLMVLMRHP